MISCKQDPLQSLQFRNGAKPQQTARPLISLECHATFAQLVASDAGDADFRIAIACNFYGNTIASSVP